ncbi:MAG: RnfABCDGE type electron transport complex subunit D [Pseudomonadales bacterium]|nr:RnfABCDGE type electron transport complex subunit D [Pseudomonadales bacterium]
MNSTSSPFQFARLKTQQIMLLVLAAASPAVLIHSWFFGYGMLLNIVLAMVIGLASEAVCLWLQSKPIKVALSDYSTLVTALLFAVTIPPGTVWWLIAMGIVFAIALVKHAYGGLGHNVFNPAMAGYLFLLLAFPLSMTAWHLPQAATTPTPDHSPLSWTSFVESLSFVFPLIQNQAIDIDGLAMATPLIEYKMAGQSAVLEAYREGLPIFSRTSETGWELVNMAYLAGGLILLSLRIISWHIPVAVIASVLVMSLLFYSDGGSSVVGTPYLHLFGSATLIGAFFIATDPVSAATSNPARIIYGVIIGCSIYGIRVWGSYLDSVAIAVLFANFCAPMLDHFFRPRIFGHDRWSPLKGQTGHE